MTIAIAAMLMVAGAQAAIITLDFSVASFSPFVGADSAPTDPVTGTISWNATSDTSDILSLISADLTIDGHAYSASEMSFTNFGTATGCGLGRRCIGGSIFGAETLNLGSNDFVIVWLPSIKTFSHLTYTSENYSFNGWISPAFITPTEFAFTTVPVPAAVWLFGSALCLLGWMRERKAA